MSKINRCLLLQRSKKKLPFDFDQNRMSNSWDIADFDGLKSFSSQTKLFHVRLSCGWVLTIDQVAMLCCVVSTTVDYCTTVQLTSVLYPTAVHAVSMCTLQLQHSIVHTGLCTCVHSTTVSYTLGCVHVYNTVQHELYKVSSHSVDARR